MPTVDELAQAKKEFACALGYMALEAGQVEFVTREILIILLEDQPTEAGRIRAGKKVFSQVVENIATEAGDHLDPTTATALIAETEKAKALMDERNGMLHAVWQQSVFEETADPARVKMRGMAEDPVSLEEIRMLEEDLKASRETLAALRTDVFFAFE